jgi:hypothetical protein
MTSERSTQGRSIFLFWLPLAATWLMMAVEGPFLAAVIARLADPVFNLAAYGVAYAFALLAEAPVIMLMSAATALIEDGPSFRRLRVFTYGLIAAVTAAMLVLLVPGVYHVIAVDMIALPAEVARRTYIALWILLPWPGAIGFRRFYQGLMIRDGRPRLVAYGTVLRLSAMTATAFGLFFGFSLPGAYVGAAALTAGVSAEAVASRWMARASIRRFATASPAAGSDAATLGFGGILRFYYPLALTSMIGLAVQPLLTFFMSRAPSPVESLAVFPVVSSLGFLFRAMGLSYQEVAIAMMGRHHEHARELGRFAVILGIASSAGLALVALTPLSTFWFGTVSGLSPELVRFAITPTILFIPLPLMSVLLSYQRGILVVGHSTRPLTWATLIEVAGIAILFPVLGWKLGMVGATAAVAAFIAGRLAGNLYLIRPCIRMLGDASATPSSPHPFGSDGPPRSDVA